MMTTLMFGVMLRLTLRLMLKVIDEVRRHDIGNSNRSILTKYSYQTIIHTCLPHQFDAKASREQ